MIIVDPQALYVQLGQVLINPSCAARDDDSKQAGQAIKADCALAQKSKIVKIVL